MIPAAFAGETGNRIIRLDSGHQDLGGVLDFELETGAVAPAGVNGDCGFEGVRLVFTWKLAAAVTITVTPILDGEAIVAAAQTVDLPVSASERSEPFELIFRRKSAGGYRFQCQGTWFALRIEGTKADGEIFVDPAVLLYEVLTPSHAKGEGG